MKASLRRKLSMKLYVLLLMKSSEWSYSANRAVTVVWVFHVTERERHLLEAVSRATFQHYKRPLSQQLQMLPHKCMKKEKVTF